MKKQICTKIKDEMRLPVSLGCFCRTRFRHAGLHLYKKRNGPRYIAILCPIKRKIRKEDNNELSEEWNRIMDYVEQHPMINKNTCVADFCAAESSPETSVNLRSKENQFRQALIELIKMGYIMQFEDGSLYASPKQTVSISNKLNAATA